MAINFLATVQQKFFAAAGITAPGASSNADDAAERAALAAAITGGDPIAIKRAALAVMLKDAEEIALQVLANRIAIQHLRQMLVGLTGLGVDGIQLSPAMQQAIIRAREGEISVSADGYVGAVATVMWSGYLAELRADSAAVLS